MSKKSLLGSPLLALIVFISIFGVANAADFTFSPRVSTSATYNDNVEEVDGGKGDYVGTVKPGLTATYDSSRVLFNLSYDLDYKNYLNDVKKDEYNNKLDALAQIEAVKERFFIEMGDSYKMVYNDTTRGDVPDGDTSNRTTDQNIFHFKPYFTIPLQARTDLTFGGEARDIWYSDEGSIDKRVYSAFAMVDHGLTETVLLTLGTNYERQDPRFVDGGYQRYNLLFGVKYTYAEGSFLEARWEPTHTDYKEDSASDKQYHPYYLGVTHAFSEQLTGELSSSLEFIEDPESTDPENRYLHQFNLNKVYSRGNIRAGLSYYDYEKSDSVSRTTYWRPSISGTHSLSERLALRYNTYCDLHTNPDRDKYWFTLFNLDYSLSEETTVGLSYRYKVNDELGTSNDYSSNTIGLNLSWSH